MLYTTLYTLYSSQWRGQDFKNVWWVQMKILMVTPSYKSRSRPHMKTRSLERTPPQKKLDLRPWMEFLPERLCILLCLRKETLQILGSPLFATDYFQL